MQSLYSGRLGYWLRVREFLWTFVGFHVEGHYIPGREFTMNEALLYRSAAGGSRQAGCGSLAVGRPVPPAAPSSCRVDPGSAFARSAKTRATAGSRDV
jgi:hypothetical protein